MKYEYTRNVIGNGRVRSETIELTSEELHREMGTVGKTAFLMLINKWNHAGLAGAQNGGPAYVYVANDSG